MIVRSLILFFSSFFICFRQPGVIMMQVDADSDTNEAEADINDVFEFILRFCPRRVWLVLNDNHEVSQRGDYCWRPDLCVSYYIKISFQRLREILEPLEWGRHFRCSAIFRPSVDLKRSDTTRPLWLLVDPSGVEWSIKPPGLFTLFRLTLSWLSLNIKCSSCINYFSPHFICKN